ncbi:hypothetical protein H0O00_05085 [Candidatus Micrarchaeota archaeon]|nr:hypothetical protein [Candidatus Micrarchaeota archaeon]
MAGARLKGGRIAVPDASATNMASRFSRYRPEEEKAVREIEVVEDKTLKKMKDAWKACNVTDEAPDDYSKILKKVKKLEYSAKDIENVSLALVEFQSEENFQWKAGAFLSALMNNSKDTEFVIHTAHLAEPIDYLGYKNTKSITVIGNIGRDVGGLMKDGDIMVDGNAGEAVGVSMKGGTITVNGNAYGYIGQEMDGGTIMVNGDAEEAVGVDMKGGSITVNGKVGEGVGIGMEGGEIRIEGEIGSIADDIKHGKIYHKGKLILEK